MAGSRKSGPLGLNPQTQHLNDGTMIRQLSPHPGTIGSKAASIASLEGRPSITRSHHKQASPTELQVLRQGSHGPEVKKLQRLINTRLMPSPQLAIDGVFSPLVTQAVLLYQKGVSVTADGIVGKETWYRLLKGETVTAGPAAVPKRPTATAAGVWEWPLADKFAEVLRRTGPKLPGSMRHEFSALISPASLGIIAGTLVVWAGSQAFGVGEIVDIVLLAGGAFFLGLAVFDVAEELGDFLVVTSTATDEKDLDEAASHLAVAIAILGVAAFIALLAKLARVRGGKGSGAEAPPEPEPAKPKPRAKTTPSKLASEPSAKTQSPKEWAEKVRGGAPKPSPGEQAKATQSYAKRKQQVKDEYDKVMRGEAEHPNATREQLKNAVEGDATGKRIPLTFKSKEQYAQFQKELREALARGGADDATVQQVGSATTGYRGNPTKEFGPWKPSSDSDFAVFSEKALAQARANNTPVNPKIVQNGEYTVFKNEVPGTDQGFYNTPVGKQLDALAQRWNTEIYGDPKVDGFDFKLNTTTKPFNSALTITGK